eukprot:1853248-Rhodomonas_salina.2
MTCRTVLVFCKNVLKWGKAVLESVVVRRQVVAEHVVCARGPAPARYPHFPTLPWHVTVGNLVPRTRATGRIGTL